MTRRLPATLTAILIATFLCSFSTAQTTGKSQPLRRVKPKGIDYSSAKSILNAWPEVAKIVKRKARIISKWDEFEECWDIRAVIKMPPVKDAYKLTISLALTANVSDTAISYRGVAMSIMLNKQVGISTVRVKKGPSWKVVNRSFGTRNVPKSPLDTIMYYSNLFRTTQKDMVAIAKMPSQTVMVKLENTTNDVPDTVCKIRRSSIRALLYEIALKRADLDRKAKK